MTWIVLGLAGALSGFLADEFDVDRVAALVIAVPSFGAAYWCGWRDGRTR